MSITDLAIAGGAAIVGFLLISGLFSLIRKQKTPPVDILGAAPRPARASGSTLSVAELGSSWHRILGVPADAALPDIEAAYQARLAECDRMGVEDADARRAKVNDAYEFIRGARR